MTSFGMLIHRLVYLICKLAIWTFEHFIVKTKGHRKKDKRTPQKGQINTCLTLEKNTIDYWEASPISDNTTIVPLLVEDMPKFENIMGGGVCVPLEGSGFPWIIAAVFGVGAYYCI